ncbi:MAG: RIO1 family regulatory kinase/ATPase [Acidimicrobiales bacterium]
MLSMLWSADVSVPYPVQLLGQELMMEFLGDDEQAALRLIDSRPSRAQAAGWFEQMVELMRGMADLGVVHGDLSPYNVLIWEDTVYVIDLPQAQIGAADTETIALLEHDVLTVCRWFDRRGVTVDTNDLLADLIVSAMQ